MGKPDNPAERTNMQLTGQSIIGLGRTENTEPVFFGMNAATGKRLEPAYRAAAHGDLDRAMGLAAGCFPSYREVARPRRAEFLRAIAEEIEAIGDALIERAMAESALPEARVRGERARTCAQLRFFAAIVEEGSWVDARIDTGDAGRQPPKPDLRSMLRPLGPVAVFCASNFPLAFSVAGGDTASALAAGNPVVVNAHFAHPGTAELCGLAIRAAAERTAMPDGVFSLLYGIGHELGQMLVAHEGIRAVGFTGSRRGGMALLKIAQGRREPIPFYAEMSSVNPVFVLPGAVAERGPRIAAGLHGSVTVGVGQFCTNPGLVLLPRGAQGDGLAGELAQKMRETGAAAMLNEGILRNYSELARARAGDAKVHTLVEAGSEAHAARPALFETDAGTLIENADLAEEVFGPSTLLVRYLDADQALEIANRMEGNLTATIHAGPGDEETARRLAAALETKVGRILFGGFPTGVEVCQAMVHGGPWPATSDGRSTSVGGRAIDRFARPVCFQDAPAELLPEELRDGNPAGVMRMVNGERGR
jgi:NADP-dependent aldehyde dehydrogenase